MDHLYQLFCIPKPPALSVKDFDNANYNQFLEKSMRSADSLNRDPELKSTTSNLLSKLLSSKSHSASNTLRTINQMFEEASKSCHFDRERALIEWLQVCVSTAVEFGLDPAAAEAKIENGTSNNEKTSNGRGANQSKPSKKKKPAVVDDDEEWDDEEYGYDRIGESDDDYCPTDEDDDGVVPITKPSRKSSPPKTTPPKSPRKKKTSGSDDDQVAPGGKKKKDEVTLPLIKEGAGAKALQKYIEDIQSVNAVSSSDILPNGYFARAFFFPSKDSFQAFLSVLRSAQKTIDICVFAFTDDDVADALIAAKKRNVKINIITDNQQAAGKGADAKRLQESYGIPFKTDNTVGYMHNKFAIVDSKTLINGSFNWSKGARFKNRENVLITNIPQCIKEYQAQFDALWAEF